MPRVLYGAVPDTNPEIRVISLLARYVFYMIASISFYVLISEIIKVLDIFLPATGIILTVLFAAAVVAYDINKTAISFGCYLAFVAVFLLFRRRPENNANFAFYLWKWFKIIGSNRTVFINVFGNLLLFLPILIYVRNRYDYLIALGLILLFEGLQYVTGRGVFDVVDIFLNAAGVTVGKAIAMVSGRLRAHNNERRTVGT
jgi:hypothetical protein